MLRKLTTSLAILALGGAALAGSTTPVKPVVPNSAWPEHPVNNWVKQTPREGGPPAPRLAYEGGGAYDPYTRTWIHHAGHEGVPQTERTFAYDLASRKWQQRFVNTAPPGSCCMNNNGFAFDTANRRMMRFGGAGMSHGWQFSRSVYFKVARCPVWTFDTVNNRWVNMRPAPYKAPRPYTKPWAIGGGNSPATYDPLHEVVIHMAKGPNSVYVYDAYANSFDKLDGKNMPPARSGHGLAYDPVTEKLAVFGSDYGNDERTWFYDYKTNAWEGLDLKPHPPGKKEGQYSTHPVMAYDSLNGVMICVIWHPKGAHHETWALELRPKPKWTAMKPATEPDKSASRTHNMTFSPEHNAFILELAPAARGPNQIWSYRYKKAPEDKRPRPPTDLVVLTGEGKAELAWKASLTAGVKEYRVFRAEADRAWKTAYKPVGKVGKTAYTDNGLTAGKVYFYRVAAIGADGRDGPQSISARTQTRVLMAPVVSVLAKDKVEVAWKASPAKDVVGYNLYRGLVTISTVKKGQAKPWRPNDPEYPEPYANGVKDITGITKLNAELLKKPGFTDSKLDLTKKGKESADYKYAVYAYLVRSVNKLGTESGPSPYALTIPSAPQSVYLRRKGSGWEIKWDANPEKGLAGYRVYNSMTQSGNVKPLVPAPKLHKATTFSGTGGRVLWVTAVDALGQEGEPSSPAKNHHRYRTWYKGEWHQ